MVHGQTDCCLSSTHVATAHTLAPELAIHSVLRKALLPPAVHEPKVQTTRAIAGQSLTAQCRCVGATCRRHVAIFISASSYPAGLAG